MAQTGQSAKCSNSLTVAIVFYAPYTRPLSQCTELRLTERKVLLEPRGPMAGGADLCFCSTQSEAMQLML